jgi:signal transduction histidine kinase/DNA-binding response OmpR family regulator/CHASE3 domain sensor protein
MRGEKLRGWRRKWPDLSLRAKGLLPISVTAAATVFLFGVANVLAARNAAAVELVSRALETSQEIQRLRAAEADTSAGARGYFITAQELFLARARSSLAAFHSTRQQLLKLTAGSPVQQQRLLQIASIEQAREERMFGAIARFQSGALPPDRLRAELLRMETGRQHMETVLKSMESDNATQIGAFRSQTARLRAEQGALTGICLILGLLGGIAIAVLFARRITGSAASVPSDLERLAGESAPEPLAGPEEIGPLNEGLIRAAEILRRKGVALDNALHGIAEVDAAGRYLWLNRIYAEMAGCSQIYTPAHIAATVQPEDLPRVEEAIAQMRRNGRSEIAACIGQPSGPSRDVAMTFLSTVEDPASSFYVFLHDIWAGQNGHAALIRAKDAALASNRARTELLVRISHDIRTPLNAILGAADLLSRTPLTFDQGEYVSMFQRNCRRLVALINDFLDFSRIEAGAVRVERVPFRIPETVDDAVATFRESTLRKGIALGVEVDPEAPAWALGDPLRIQQVLVNLLSNALKFTAHGRVDVKVKVLRALSAGDQLRYEVCDTGPGIRLEDQDRIFAQFVQLPNQNNGQRGAGLGLTICRHLVELMGGEIGVVSREGGGSTFHFSLPLEAVEPVMADPAVGAPPTQLPSSEPISILVAEDGADNRLLLEHYLRDQPVKLRVAQNGQEALDAVQQGEHFDLILMDIDMPVMDGYTATRRIRAWQQSQGLHPQGLAAPIIALSADAMREAVRASMDAGCVAHLAKPMDKDTLLKTIRHFVPRQGAQPPRATPAMEVSEQVKALVPQYLASKEKQIEEARACLASRDFGPIRRFGHNLKGTGRGYGFPPIEILGIEIERAAAQADASRIAEQLDALHRFVTESATAAWRCPQLPA